MPTYCVALDRTVSRGTVGSTVYSRKMALTARGLWAGGDHSGDCGDGSLEMVMNLQRSS